MQREHTLWTKERRQSTHPSHDETAGRTLAQDHPSKQKMKSDIADSDGTM